jgi:cytochrome c oxidase subunit 2
VFAESNLTDSYNRLFVIVTVISIIVALGVIALTLFFTYRFRETNETSRAEISHETARKLEFTWTIVAVAIVLLLMLFSYPILINDIDNSGDAIDGDPVVIVVEGTNAWTWRFYYLNASFVTQAGITENPALPSAEPGVKHTTLTLIKDVPVKLILWASGPYIHSFYAPEFNFKMDAVPGYNNTFTFVPKAVGTFDLFCAEFCGPNHSYMRGYVEVLP